MAALETQLVIEEFSQKEGVAMTFEENAEGDRALLMLAKHRWFKIFIITSICFAASEPILIAFPNETNYAQKVILAASTMLFIFGYLATMAMMPPDVSLKKRFRAALFPEVWIEIICLLVGWAFIFEDPALASLRCFRIFRFFWYSEFYRAQRGSPFYALTFFCHMVLQYLERIGRELFTTSSKGGVIVLGFFFYIAYIVGATFWQKTHQWDLPAADSDVTAESIGDGCDTLPHCFFIMLRLSFWDGSGFDYVKTLMDSGSPGLVVLLIVYMCASVMVLLNGLIGIFGNTFTSNEGTTESNGESPLVPTPSPPSIEDFKRMEAAMERIERMCIYMQKEIVELRSELHSSATNENVQ
eukprot:TRINITY_DN12496_c0_g1_i1.p1 TRINITY_DN12496_c0_g1~~TRINITY_DN12496_c0_g1_i1.p1  ORF type:complete len:356 (-),score=62.64 TRINITY_DN12496_c0_g1_i1:25-1092(-)